MCCCSCWFSIPPERHSESRHCVLGRGTAGRTGFQKLIDTFRKQFYEPNSFISSYLVQFSHSVLSDSLQPHGQQHTRLPCPSPTSRACSNSCPSSQWCHPSISSSVIPFSSRLQSFLASESFPMSWLFASFRWPKYWSFNFIISPSNEYSGLISFRVDW